jgi:NADH:ubiquinone oxidoreductase subunit K
MCKANLFVFIINLENNLSFKENYTPLPIKFSNSINSILINSSKNLFNVNTLNSIIGLEYYLVLNVVLFAIAIFALSIVQKNMLHTMLSIELLYFSSIANFVVFAFYLDSALGNIIAMVILALVSAESIMGLTFILLFFFKHKTIGINYVNLLQT